MCNYLLCGKGYQNSHLLKFLLRRSIGLPDTLGFPLLLGLGYKVPFISSSVVAAINSLVPIQINGNYRIFEAKILFGQ